MMFAIIIPTFNRPDLLLRGLHSITNMQASQWQAFIVNDGSSVEYDLGAFKDDPRIHYFKLEDNLGVNHARNYAIDRALESDIEWLLFFDDDDRMTPDALISATEEIQHYPQERWFVSNIEIVNKEPQYQKEMIKNRGECDYISDYLYGDGSHGLHVDLVHIIHRDVVEGVKFSSWVKNGEEWLFYFRLAKKTQIHYYPAISKTYEYQPDGLTALGLYGTCSFKKVWMKTARPLLGLWTRPTHGRLWYCSIRDVIRFPLRIIELGFNCVSRRG